MSESTTTSGSPGEAAVADRMGLPTAWIPVACALVATVAVGFRFIGPALADADRAESERLAFENVARSLRGVNAAADALATERDRLREEIEAHAPAMDADLLAACRSDAAGLLRLELTGPFELVSWALHAVDHSSGIAVRECSIERMGSADALRLRMTLDPIGGDIASLRAVRNGPAGIAGAEPEIATEGEGR